MKLTECRCGGKMLSVVWVDDVMMKVREARPGGTFVFWGAGLGNVWGGDRISWSPAGVTSGSL